MTPPLTAVVDLAAIRTNLELVRRAVAPGTEIIGCVKANAYGHGVGAVARELETAGLRWLSLGSPAEALAVRAGGVSCGVLLFPTVLPPEIRPLLDARITLAIQSYAEAERLAREGQPVSLFLKVDSGLGRVGVALDEAPALARRLARELPGIVVEGVFTHLPFQSVESLPWITSRLKAFGEAVARVREQIAGPLVVQALASSGILCELEAPETNAVCPGGLLFGLEPRWVAPGVRSAALGTRSALVKVTIRLGGTRELAAGSQFGMGGMRTATRATRLGVLPIGYSNSILTPKPGQAVGIEGAAAPIVSLSLEHTVVDLTDVPGAREGAPAVLVARAPSVGPSLAEVARNQGRSELEVLVALSRHAAYEYVGGRA
jgi:alanine racemase